MKICFASDSRPSDFLFYMYCKRVLTARRPSGRPTLRAAGRRMSAALMTTQGGVVLHVMRRPDAGRHAGSVRLQTGAADGGVLAEACAPGPLCVFM